MSDPNRALSALNMTSASSWLERYGQAWETGDADLIIALFSQDGSYRETPFDVPMVGHGAIKRYWLEQPCTHRDVTFRFHIWALAGDQCFSNWTSKFYKGDRFIELDGAFRLLFCEDPEKGLLCHTLEEWWHERSAPS